MKQNRIRRVIRWLEIIVNMVFLPAAIVAILLSPIIGIPPNVIQELILAVLVLIAASISLSRFGTLNDIAEQTRQLTEFSNIKLLRSVHEAGVVNLFLREDPEGLHDIVTEIERCRGTLDL
jgi:hypothetical protein